MNRSGTLWLWQPPRRVASSVDARTSKSRTNTHGRNGSARSFSQEFRRYSASVGRASQWVRSDILPMTTWGVKVNCVCSEDCNSGWMSELEIAVQPILSPMIRDGGQTLLSKEQQQLLAAWACKTVMVFEFTSAEPAFYTFAERDELRRTMSPPAVHMSVLIGRYVTGSFMGIAFGRRVDFDLRVDDQLVRGRADYSSISLGQLVVQVVGFRLPVDVERILVPNMRDWSGHAVRVWPPRHPSASWPPTNSFDNETLQQFVRPFP